MAPRAHSIPQRDLEQLVLTAQATFDPAAHAARAAEQAERRDVTIDHQRLLPDGLSYVDGCLDAADAVELERAIAHTARQLLTLHPDAPLGVRRARALGYLARGHQVETTGSPARTARRVVLHVHLSEHAIAHGGLCHLDEGGRLVLPVERLAEWLAVPVARITATPVVDLDAHQVTDSYEVPDRIREQVELRDLTCAFPWCARPARACDLDHVVPWEVGGATSTSNLAPLCRRHHRHKAHAGTDGRAWTYDVLTPGTVTWTSPHGLRFVRCRDGTSALG